MKTIYLQKNEEDEIFSDFVFAAYIGFQDRKFRYAIKELKFFQKIEEVPVDKNNIIIGSIENTSYFFEKLNIKVPAPINMPKELEELSKRKSYITTLGEVRNYTEDKFPLFIKTVHKTTDFIAGPIKNKYLFNCSYNYYDNNFSDDLEVVISEVINFIGEYRCFINEGKITGIKHYINDFTVFPDIDYINKCIKAFKNCPIAYTLDVGITDKGETLLVECNDAWSIGNYGLDATIYSDILFKRWNEIIK